MVYKKENVIKACEDDPSLIFDLIKNSQMDLVDYVISKKKVDINTTDEAGNNIMIRLLKAKEFDLVLKYMNRSDWDINHQNIDGNTFAHYLVSIHDMQVIDIMKSLKRKRNFIPNIKNKKGETILDKSIHENSIYATLKVLEDNRFNMIDIISFKKIYDTYIKSSYYGRYSKVDNLTIIIDSLDKKEGLLPIMKELITNIKRNMKIIKDEMLKNKSKYLDSMINQVLLESSI